MFTRQGGALYNHFQSCRPCTRMWLTSNSRRLRWSWSSATSSPRSRRPLLRISRPFNQTFGLYYPRSLCQDSPKVSLRQSRSNSVQQQLPLPVQSTKEPPCQFWILRLKTWQFSLQKLQEATHLPMNALSSPGALNQSRFFGRKAVPSISRAQSYWRKFA